MYDEVTGAYHDSVGVGSPALISGNLNYVAADGSLQHTPLPGGGELIDGAFVANNNRPIVSPRDFVGTQG